VKKLDIRRLHICPLRP